MTVKELNNFDSMRKQVQDLVLAAKEDPIKLDEALTTLTTLGEKIQDVKRKTIKDETIEIKYLCSECDASCQKTLKFEVKDPKYCEDTGLSGEANFVVIEEHKTV